MLDSVSYKCFSFFYHVNPITKLVCSFLLTISILFMEFNTLFFLFFLYLCLCFFFKISYRFFFSFPFFISILVFLFTYFWDLNISLRFSFFLKTYLFLLSFSFLFMITSLSDFYYALEKILSPLQKFSIDVSSLAYKVVLFFLFLMFVDLFHAFF